MIESIDKQESPELKTDIKDAIDRIESAWDIVSRSTIINCFQKAGINPKIQLSPPIISARPPPIISQEDWNRIEYLKRFSYEDYSR